MLETNQISSKLRHRSSCTAWFKRDLSPGLMDHTLRGLFMCALDRVNAQIYRAAKAEQLCSSRGVPTIQFYCFCIGYLSNPTKPLTLKWQAAGSRPTPWQLITMMMMMKERMLRRKRLTSTGKTSKPHRNGRSAVVVVFTGTWHLSGVMPWVALWRWVYLKVQSRN